MAVGRSERFEIIRPRVIELFGSDEATLGRVSRVIELMERAWHDSFGEPSPPSEVVRDVLTCSGGTIEGLLDSAHLAVTDWRDLRVAASRAQSKPRRLP